MVALGNRIAHRRKIRRQISGLDTYVAPADRRAGLFGRVAYLVHLQGYETLTVGIVHDIGRRHAVNPHAQRMAHSLDTKFVPLAVTERLPSLRLVLKRIEPSASRLVIDAAIARR